MLPITIEELVKMDKRAYERLWKLIIEKWFPRRYDKGNWKIKNSFHEKNIVLE